MLYNFINEFKIIIKLKFIENWINFGILNLWKKNNCKFLKGYEILIIKVIQDEEFHFHSMSSLSVDVTVGPLDVAEEVFGFHPIILFVFRDSR